MQAGTLSMGNITFLVSDDRLAKEPVLTGHPILKHLRVDTETPLEQNIGRLNGIDCSEVGAGGYVIRVMSTRFAGT